jgi:membrane associated rhomboid family serine protease
MGPAQEVVLVDQRKRMLTAAMLPALTLVVIWAVFLLDRGLGLDLYRFGILPREWSGLAGVLFSPFLHGDAEHVFNNSVPLMVLGWGLMYFYPRIAGKVVLAAWLISGIWVWISARGNYHIGASGVVYGLAAFLFFSGVLRRQRTLMALSLLVVFLYGSMIWGIFPIVPRVSWESHLWGGVAGALMAWLYRGVPPAVQDPVPAVMDDEDDDEEEEEISPTPGAIPGLRSMQAPLRIVYHSGPLEEKGDQDLRATDGPPPGGQDLDPDRTSGTWPGDGAR